MLETTTSLVPLGTFRECDSEALPTCDEAVIVKFNTVYHIDFAAEANTLSRCSTENAYHFTFLPEHDGSLSYRVLAGDVDVFSIGARLTYEGQSQCEQLRLNGTYQVTAGEPVFVSDIVHGYDFSVIASVCCLSLLCYIA